MPRPRRCRRVGHRFGHKAFKPAGFRAANLEEVIISVDEIEAVRLKDALGLSQEECALEMDISQPTFHRLLNDARKKIADIIVNGKALRIDGGNIRYR